MELVVRGWLRDHGPRTIMEGDVSTAPLNDDEGRYSWGKPSLRFSPSRVPSDSDAIKFYKSAELKGLNGNYLVELRLRKSEVARLFAVCFQDDPLSSVVLSLESATEYDAGSEN